MKKIMLLFLLLFSISKNYSCECSEKPSIKKNWKSSDEVFIGKIMNVDTMLYGNNGAKIYSYIVRINKSFKEEFFKTREYRTIISQDEAGCDFMFEIGKEYLIYAKTDNQTLACSICSRTNFIENIEKEELKELEVLQKEYFANSNDLRILKVENNLSYQIGLVKNSFEEKTKKKNLIIYGLLVLIIFLISFILMTRKRKN
jgi:hypothetical protein